MPHPDVNGTASCLSKVELFHRRNVLDITGGVTPFIGPTAWLPATFDPCAGISSVSEAPWQGANTLHIPNTKKDGRGLGIRFNVALETGR